MFTITQERGKALSLVEDQPDSGTAAPVDSKVTVKGPDYNELVVTVDKCRGLMSSTSGMLILTTLRESVQNRESVCNNMFRCTCVCVKGDIMCLYVDVLFRTCRIV